MHFTFPRACYMACASNIRFITSSNIVCQFPPLFQGDCVLNHTRLRLISKPSRQEVTKDANIKHCPCTPVSGTSRYEIIPCVMFYMSLYWFMHYLTALMLNQQATTFSFRSVRLLMKACASQQQHNATSDTQLPDFQKPQQIYQNVTSCPHSPTWPLWPPRHNARMP